MPATTTRGPASGVEPFIEGNSFRILYVPILPKAAPTPDRSFAVELTGASDGVDLGPTPRVEVNDPRVDLSAGLVQCGVRARAAARWARRSPARRPGSSASMRAGIAFSTVSRSASGTGADSR